MRARQSSVVARDMTSAARLPDFILFFFLPSVSVAASVLRTRPLLPATALEYSCCRVTSKFRRLQYIFIDNILVNDDDATTSCSKLVPRGGFPIRHSRQLPWAANYVTLFKNILLT